MPNSVYTRLIPPNIEAIFRSVNGLQNVVDAEVEIISSRPLTTTDGIVPEEIEPEEIAVMREIVTPPEQKPIKTMVTI